jgi:hypothetical protein
VSPQVPPAKVDCIPKTLEETYTEIGLPQPRPATAGEKRAATNNRRCVTRLRTIPIKAQTQDEKQTLAQGFAGELDMHS